MSKYYEIVTWADGNGRWYGRAIFHRPLAIKASDFAAVGYEEHIRQLGIYAAKREIRREIQLRQSAAVRRLTYEVTDGKYNDEGHLVTITVRETFWSVSEKRFV